MPGQSLLPDFSRETRAVCLTLALKPPSPPTPPTPPGLRVKGISEGGHDITSSDWARVTRAHTGFLRQRGGDGAGHALGLTPRAPPALIPGRLSAVLSRKAVFGRRCSFPAAAPGALRNCGDREVPLGGCTRPCLVLQASRRRQRKRGQTLGGHWRGGGAAGRECGFRAVPTGDNGETNINLRKAHIKIPKLTKQKSRGLFS